MLPYTLGMEHGRSSILLDYADSVLLQTTCSCMIDTTLAYRNIGDMVQPAWGEELIKSIPHYHANMFNMLMDTQ